MYVLDTNVISELRKPRPHGAVVAWVSAQPREALFLSAMTVGEIQAGIEITRDQDPPKAAEIEAWLEEVCATHAVLPMDAVAFRAWARLMHHRSGNLIEDAMIAATALVHGFAVVTRNSRDFTGFGVPLVNPFSPIG